MLDKECFAEALFFHEYPKYVIMVAVKFQKNEHFCHKERYELILKDKLK